MNLIEYQLDKMYKTISFGNDCAKKIAIKKGLIKLSDLFFGVNLLRF